MEQQANEELKNYKLFRIQETEAKLKRFRRAYLETREHEIVKLSKNITSDIIRIPLLLLALACLIFGVFLFLLDLFIDIMPLSLTLFFDLDEKVFLVLLKVTSYFLIILSMLFGFICYLLNSINKKRNSLYNLSKLFEEVMSYMEKSSFDEKRKYEYFVDSMGEKERMKKDTGQKV